MTTHREFYDILSVDVNADDRVIKKAYMKLVRQYHPDKVEKKDYTEDMKKKFLKIQRAYEILSDPEKRKLYDRFGEDAFNENANGGRGGQNEMPSGFTDMFEHIFGDGGPFGSNGPFARANNGGSFGGAGSGNNGFNFSQQRGPQRNEPTIYNLQISLENAFHGVSKTLRVTSKKRCGVCKGVGCVSAQDKNSCSDCNGRGMRVQMRQMGPFTMQQSHVACQKCKSRGFVIAKGKECKTCKGNRLIDMQNNIQVAVPKGVPNNHKFIYKGMGNDNADNNVPAGDVVIVIKIKTHPVFRRLNDTDLYVEQTILLHQSLCGFVLELPYLNGNKLSIPINDVIAPGYSRIIPQKGMPLVDNPVKFGNLVVKFDVKFPKTISKQKQNIIREALI